MGAAGKVAQLQSAVAVGVDDVLEARLAGVVGKRGFADVDAREAGTQVGRQLREMMPWLSSRRLVDKAKN